MEAKEGHDCQQEEQGYPNRKTWTGHSLVVSFSNYCCYLYMLKVTKVAMIHAVSPVVFERKSED